MTPLSGRILGAHQKIDRLARRNVARLGANDRFPTAWQILHFEGYNGPDAIKRKSPAKDEPWHFFQPFDEADTQLVAVVTAHYRLLVKALRAHDVSRAAFEAAWLAHAITDGLTPAHHYPFEEKLVELRGGRSALERSSVKEKIVLPGDTLRDAASNNWQFWGPKGLFTTHFAFEWGVATLMKPLRLPQSLPNQIEIDRLLQDGMPIWFRSAAQQVASLKLYDDFYVHGWTINLSRQVRRSLAPMLVKAVSTAWYCALLEAEAAK